MECMRNLYIFYHSVCKLKTQILFTRDLALKIVELGKLEENIIYINGIQKALKTFYKKILESLTPRILGPSTLTRL